MPLHSPVRLLRRCPLGVRGLANVFGTGIAVLLLSAAVLAAQPSDPGAVPPASGSAGEAIPSASAGLVNFPARPASRVLDQMGAMPAGERAVLTKDFTAAAQTGPSVYFVTLAEAGNPSETEAANALAWRWEDAPLTVVLLQVPGRPLALGFAGQQAQALDSGTLQARTAQALAAGRGSASLAEQARAVVRHILKDFAAPPAAATAPEAPGSTDAEPARLPETAGQGGPSRHPGHNLIVRGGSAAVLLLAGFWLWVRHRRTRRARLFPPTEPRTRFSAPHSGGNNAMTAFPNGKDGTSSSGSGDRL